MTVFRADWLNVVFLHFRVDGSALQRIIPLELDRFDSQVYVSLVAFTQARLRPAVGGRRLQWLSAPLARHEFLNLRTYVRCGNVRGIYFIAEWIPNRLAALIGPRTYGLPYRLGRPDCRNDPRRDEIGGRVCAREKAVSYAAALRSRDFHVAEAGTLDEFLLERYTAFTCRGDIVRRFDVDHEPWPQVSVDAKLDDVALLADVGDWLAGAQLVGANYSPGVYDVAISAPARLADTSRRPGSSKSPPA